MALHNWRKKKENIKLLSCELRHNPNTACIQLFREGSSEKVHATIAIGIVGGFELTKFERIAQEAMDICLLVLKESNKSRFDSHSVRKKIQDFNGV